MTAKPPVDDVSGITSLSDAINVIKFLKVSHKAELAKWREACKKQARIIKNLESNRHQELTFLSNQLHKYEINLLNRENAIAKEIAEKDDTIDKLNHTIESLQSELHKLSVCASFAMSTRSDSSDSGILADKTEDEDYATESKTKESPKKRHSSFRKSINFFRKVDFSPRKSKKPDSPTSKKASGLRKAIELWKPVEKTSSEEEKSSCEDLGALYPGRPHKMDESMNNHFCQDPSDSEREQLFERVMTRTSVRRSVKTNLKYQKISRNKSKYLEGLRNVCEYADSS